MMGRMERGCCIVVYGLSYLVALPIGFLIGKVLGPERIMRILGLETEAERAAWRERYKQQGE